MLQGEKIAPIPSAWNSGTPRPVTYVVSGEFPHQKGEDNYQLSGPSVVWIAYHHTTTTGQTIQGALVQETEGAGNWVRNTLVQLQEKLTARYTTARPVKIFTSYQERQQQSKTDGLKSVGLGVKTPQMEGVLSGQQKPQTALDVSVKMMFSVPESLDKGLVRQQDNFQVQGFYSKDSPKWNPALELVMTGEIIESANDISVPENSKDNYASLTRSSISHNSLSRVYGFKADSTGDDHDFKLSKKFIGAKRRILSQPQHDMLPPLYKKSEDGEPDNTDTTRPSHTVVEPAMLPTKMLESPGTTTSENDYTEVTNDPGTDREELSTPCFQDDETSEETATVPPHDLEASPTTSNEHTAPESPETECTEVPESVPTESPPSQTTIHTRTELEELESPSKTSIFQPLTATENLETECTEETQMPAKNVDDVSLTTAGPEMKTTVENTVENKPTDVFAEPTTAAERLETEHFVETEFPPDRKSVV